ncbi:MAG: alanine racemase [Clostridiaceae bacterium]|jgi:alanine racemase|nr:alanine racemase [Clostridiaceae bacterium]
MSTIEKDKPRETKRAWAEISKQALLNNLHVIAKRSNKTIDQIVAVVKANAYGHNMTLVAPFLEKAGVKIFTVATIDEAIALRACCPDASILILGTTDYCYTSDLKKHQLMQTVVSDDDIQGFAIASEKAGGPPLGIHLKLDTGLARLGFPSDPSHQARTAEAMLKATSYTSLDVRGVYTHFASSGEDPDYSDKQRRLFNDTLALAKEHGFPDIACHISNSSAILEPPNDNDDYVRPGLALYGGKLRSTSDSRHDLLPVMTVKARIEQIRDIEKGARVSYGGTWVAHRPTRLAVVAIGYADGLPRVLSNRGSLLYRGHDCPIRGAVCMDHIIVDITGLQDVKPGDTMMFFGKDTFTERAASDVAHLCGTIDYELFCGISERIPRLLVP